jgi:hypothetical protein
MWNLLRDSVETDLTLDQIIALARLAAQVDPDDIRFAVIDEQYTMFHETDDGQQVLILLREKMRELRDDFLTTEEAPDQQESDSSAELEKERATIEVLNGTVTAGLAADVTERLRQEGLNVTYTGNAARQDMAESLVVSHTDETRTAQYIARLLNLPESAVVQGSEPAAEYDVSLILGADYRPPQ